MPSKMHLWSETPLIQSSHISRILGCKAYLKMENVHPCHSFKYRGISHFVQRSIETHGSSVHIVIASGGNAGAAAATAANNLGVKCSVYLPEGALQQTIELLEGQNARVIVGGKHYAAALRAAGEVVESENNAVMVPAYDDPVVWEGHSSLIEEIRHQLDVKPDAVFCSVGGAGLLGGIITGLNNVGWNDVPIVTLGTIGSNCFHHSVLLNKAGLSHALPAYAREIQSDSTRLKIAHFNEFHSKASGSLGASEPSHGVLKLALERSGSVTCASVPDEASMSAAVQFADDHKVLVELACSTTLTAAYNPALFNRVVPVTQKKPEDRVVVFVVCGGFKVTLDDIVEYRQQQQARGKEGYTVLVDEGEMQIA